jgi:hypothetical protein
MTKIRDFAVGVMVAVLLFYGLSVWAFGSDSAVRSAGEGEVATAFGSVSLAVAWVLKAAFAGLSALGGLTIACLREIAAGVATWHRSRGGVVDEAAVDASRQLLLYWIDQGPKRSNEVMAACEQFWSLRSAAEKAKAKEASDAK